MSKYHDDNTYAVNPGNVSLAAGKLRAFQGEIGFFQRISLMRAYPADMLDEHLQMGDSRAAIVVRTDPHVYVAAYTGDIDCIALLRFPDFVKRFYELDPGTRLLTINTYSSGNRIAKDLRPGPGCGFRWNNFHPLIAEFLSNDLERIEQRKQAIDQKEWDRALACANEYVKINSLRARNGSPYFSDREA